MNERDINVRQVRDELKLSQHEIALELGVTQNAVAQWEGGSRRISGPTARLLLMLLERHRARQTA